MDDLRPHVTGHLEHIQSHYSAKFHGASNASSITAMNRRGHIDSQKSLGAASRGNDNADMGKEQIDPVHLHRIDASQNMQRFYSLVIEPTPFGGASVTHIKPAKKNVVAFMRKIRTIIKGAADVKQEYLIMRLNPVIRGWTNYHHNQVAKETFRKVDHLIWKCLWQWAFRRHPGKPLRWVKYHYFAREGTRDWVFRTGMKDKAGNFRFIRLIHASDVPIRRHCKIRAEANPFDPMWDSYFAGRRGLPTEVTDRPGDSTSHTDAQELATLVKQGLAEA